MKVDEGVTAAAATARRRQRNKVDNKSDKVEGERAPRGQALQERLLVVKAARRPGSHLAATAPGDGLAVTALAVTATVVDDGPVETAHSVRRTVSVRATTARHSRDL
jgi:hypothetical protein